MGAAERVETGRKRRMAEEAGGYCRPRITSHASQRGEDEHTAIV